MSSPRSRRRGLGYDEVLVVVVLAIVLTLVVYSRVQDRRMVLFHFYGAPAIEELQPLRSKFDGQTRSSRAYEEWIIRDYFNDRRGGVFLDVGANHYKNDSNTYFLETSLGWSGIAVDALEEFAADYKAHRPQTRYVAMFASDVRDRTVQFFVAENSLVSSVDREFVRKHESPSTARTVPTTTLDAVLDQAGIKKLDFMSMDIELAEPKALAGFDIDRFKPGLVCIEGHEEVRQQILDYFANHGYVVVGKYMRIDPYNLYFKRLQ